MNKKDNKYCMCSNGDTPVCAICPANIPCIYMKSYVDQRGWKYKVMNGIGGDNFKVNYNKPGKSGWHGVKNLPRREFFDQAQADLNQLAEKKGWKEYW